jgi:hypothetical protein
MFSTHPPPRQAWKGFSCVGLIRENISVCKYGVEPTLEKICAIENWVLVSYQEYCKFNNYIEKNHKYIYIQGMNCDTNQVSFSISKYTKTNNYIKEFEYLLTLIRPDKNNRKIISIIDKDLSEYGAYQLLDGVEITKTTYGRTTVIAKFDSVKECLDYIYQEIT